MENGTRTVGVVVGRFQVARLHRGHRHLIETARAAHEHLLIVIGSASFPTPRNPLTYDMRRTMLRKEYPEAAIFQIMDHPSDGVWSKSLDALIQGAFPGERAVLYGSRDSFIPCYSGTFATAEVEELQRFSGTLARERTARKILSSPAFRAGVIHNFANRLAVTRPMVDIAVLGWGQKIPDLHQGQPDVLLGQKETDNGLWRFIGGLIDPDDATLERGGLRELSEEVPGIKVTELHYIGSRMIEDWRYKDSGETGMTSFFRTDYVSGAAAAGDDLDRIAWKNISELPACLVPEHAPLGQMLLKSLAAAPREPANLSL